jgi:nucleotide-binding universal stress UspA family protein
MGDAHVIQKGPALSADLSRCARRSGNAKRGFFAQQMDASLTAVVPELSPDPGTWPVVMGGWVDVTAMIHEAIQLSTANAAKLSTAVQQAATDFTVPVEIRKTSDRLFPSAHPLVDMARLHDILILPIPETNDFDRDLVHPAIFGTGHPVLLLSHGKGRKPLHKLDRIAVAWDFSREAARALSDSLPLLRIAREVIVFSVTGEKGIHTSSTMQDAESHLKAHGIQPVLEEIAIRNETIGECISRHVSAANADMLVMGAYGHSRAREFVLGGATKSLIADPRLPIFLSH